MKLRPVTSPPAPPECEVPFPGRAADPGGPWELAAGLGLSFWVIILHCQYYIYAGPLWRDEVGSIDFASMPSLGDLWHNLQYDNFPPLFVLVARGWLHLGLADQPGWRVLGILVALGTLAVIWVGARAFHVRAPLLVLALYAVNPLGIRFGDAMRPYGLGIAFTLLAFALIWKCAENPSAANLVWAAFTAIASVQSLYQAAIFVFAFSVGAVVVARWRRGWESALKTCLPGAAAAVSLLPHIPNILKGRDWLEITARPVTLRQIASELASALSEPGHWARWIWVGGILVTLVMAVRLLMTLDRKNSELDKLIYCLIAQLLGGLLFAGFLFTLGMQPRTWYFLIFLAPTAFGLDMLWAAVFPRKTWWLRAGVAVVVATATAKAALAGVEMRSTNLDLVARALEQDAKPGDMIIVSPWYYGVSLQRYFPASRFVTLPPMSEIRIHRYDLMKTAMQSENPMGPVVDQIRKTLTAGQSVWVLGLIAAPPQGQTMTTYPPYHGDGPKPADAAYFFSWMYQVEQVIATHATAYAQADIPVPDNVAVNPLEKVSVTVFHGWKN